MPSGKAVHETLDAFRNDVGGEWEKAWFGREVSEAHSSIKQGAYDLPYAETDGVSIENIPALELGETAYDRTWGAEASPEAVYGEASVGGASATPQITPDIAPPTHEPEIDLEPEA